MSFDDYRLPPQQKRATERLYSMLDAAYGHPHEGELAEVAVVVTQSDGQYLRLAIKAIIALEQIRKCHGDRANTENPMFCADCLTRINKYLREVPT